jgi:hypothetical protein
MSERPYRVHVVVDPHYGERIRDLPAGEPAWVADSPDNHPVIQAMWQERRTLDQFTGITSFKCDPNDKPDDSLISILSAVDLHHGEYSHKPPYSVLNVIGTSWSEAIQEKLDQYGFAAHEDTAGGFIARRDIDERPQGQSQ